MSPSARNAASSGVSLSTTASCSTVTVALTAARPAVAVIVAVPLPAAVTSPEVSTCATAVSLDDQSTGTGYPLASAAPATRRSVSPSARNATSSGVRVRVTASCSTVTVALTAARPAVAVIVAVPLPAAVTRPEASTCATPASLDDHVTLTGCPFASFPSTTRRSVSPSARNATSSGVKLRATASCSTSTAALPVTEPVAAAIVAVPLPTAVTRPVASTSATPALFDDQVTAVPAMPWPFWSRTSAVSCTAASSAASRTCAGFTTIVVARGGSTGAGGSVAPSPHVTLASTADASTRVLRRLIELRSHSSETGIERTCARGRSYLPFPPG